MAVKFSRQSLFYLSLLNIIGMGALGFIIIHFSGKTTIARMLWTGAVWWKQVLYGSVFGLGTGGLGLLLVRRKSMSKFNLLFSDLFSRAKPGIFHIIFYSTCAAVGEEVLFRGAIQQWIFVWPTAVLFVLLHGYLNPRKIMLFIYGLFLILVSAGFGYLYYFYGIWSAITAHMLFDILMFWVIVRLRPDEEPAA
jgi:membrane protease YdiL (CAAX protease family)